MRDLEVKYEALYQEYYEKRRQVIQGTLTADPESIAEFEKRAVELDDEDYKSIEAEACAAISEIKGTTSGVASFWLRGMLN